MLKTAQELTTALKSAKRSLAPLELDPVTNLEQGLRGLAALAFFGICMSWLAADELGPSNRLVYSLIAVTCLLIIVFVFTYNEYWEVDLTRRRVHATSSWFGFKNHSTQFDFDQVLSVALSSHHHSHKNSQWWEYGMTILTRDGVMHPIFPNLSRNFKDVWDCAEALATLLDAPLVKPVRAARLEVRNGPNGPELCYEDQDQAHLQEPWPVTYSLTEPAPEEDENDESQPRRRLEFAEDCGKMGLIGCGLPRLMLTAPLLLFVLLSFRGSKSNIALACGLSSAAIVYWLITWFLSPVRRVTYIDPAGIVGLQEFQRRGSPTESKIVVPPGAKVVLMETTARARMVWELVLKKDGASLWLFNHPTSREQGKQDGRTIARTLAIPFEANSDFER